MDIQYDASGRPLCSRDKTTGGQCTQPVKEPGEACFAHKNVTAPGGTASLMETSVDAAQMSDTDVRDALGMKWNEGLETQEETVATAVAAGAPVILWGKPGTGKTSMLYQLATSMGFPMQPEGGSIVLNAAQRDPTDFIGLPFVVDYEPPAGMTLDELAGSAHATEEVPPKWAQELNARGGLLFIDEINTAPPSVQKALLSIVQERRIGSMHLGDNVHIVLAANPPDSLNGNIPLDPAMANRMCHVEWDPSVERFISGTMGGGFVKIAPPNPRRDPEKLEAAEQTEAAIMAAFLQSQGASALMSMPDSPEKAERGWPSPRSWTNLYHTLATARVLGTGKGAIDRIITGTVGTGIGKAYQTYRRNMDLPDPRNLVDGKGVKIAELAKSGSEDRLVATSLALVSYVQRTVLDDKRPFEERQRTWNRFYDLCAEIVESNKSDVAANAIRRVIKGVNDRALIGRLQFPASITKLRPVLEKAGLMNQS